MKKSFTLLTALFTIALANAQLVVDTSANWQQLIPTILGGNCVQISNVTYNAGPGTSAVYTNFPGFGDGILITTGTAANAQGINDQTSAGNDNGLVGTPLLDQQLPPGTFTHDATSLYFTFTSSYSGMVTVDYIFASEEYPEFVNAGFNDIFGFFVSGPNIQGGQQNIALIPGTQIPVSIDNVSPLTNTSFYVDNTNGTQLQYDGYTVPLTASFYADSGAVYTLSIIIADVGDGIFDSGVFLKTYATNSQSITGNVSHLGQPATAGVAELFGFNTDSSAAPLIDAQPIVNGSYIFNNVSSGAYNIRVTLDTAVYPNTYPLYYDSAYIWNDANIISTPCANYNLDMQLLVLDNGNGTIEGTIGNSGQIFNKSTQQDGPLVGAHVLLVGVANNKVYGFELTDENGLFRFTGVADGSYAIYIDAPGLLMDGIRTVDITPTNRTFTNQNYIVGANKIIVNDTPLPVNENTVIAWVRTFPNPTANDFTLRFKLKEPAVVTIDLIDVTGKVAGSVYTGPLSAGVQQIPGNLNGIDNGIYFLRLITNNNPTRVIKITKSAAY